MKKSVFFSVFLCLSTALATGGKKLIDLSFQESKVEFFAIGKPSLLKIKGTGGKLIGNLELEKNQVRGRLKVRLAEFTTGIDLRDQHMREKYLEIEKYPEAWIEIEKIDLPEDFINVKKVYSSVPFQGKLSLHGVEKPIKGTADVDITKDLPNVSTEFKVLVSDFKIDIPTYLGIKVADEVTIKTQMSLNFAKQ